MKKFYLLFAVCMAAAIAGTGCSEASYEPKEEDFTFEVTVQSKTLTQGENLEFTVELTGVNEAFTYQASSSTLCNYYFDLKEKGDPVFTRDDAMKSFTIPEKYHFEEQKTVGTADREPGEYLLAVNFWLKDLTFRFEETIIVLSAE